MSRRGDAVVVSAVVVMAVGWVAGWLLLWRVPRLVPRVASGPALLDCTVVIPARDEEASLPALLSDLTRQSPAPAQIVVIDDGSRDGTARVAAAFAGVQVVPGAALAAGWTGKAWACAQGAQRATGSTLVFLDADVRMAPGALAALVEAQQERGGLLSVQPFHRAVRVYEQASAVCNVVSVMGVGMAAAGGRARIEGAFGPCLVCDRATYESVGGHGAVRGQVIEDMALARVMRRAGHPVRALGGGSMVSFRMYPSGPAQLLEGWSKNLAAGAGSAPVLRTGLVALWVTALLTSSQHAAQASVGAGSLDLWVPLAAYLAFALQHRLMLRQIGSFGRLTALAFPLTTCFFVLVFCRSFWLTVVRRRVSWRGRDIALGGGVDEQSGLEGDPCP